MGVEVRSADDAPEDKVLEAEKRTKTDSEAAQRELSIGIVGADSKLHFASRSQRNESEKSRWRWIDWFLGTNPGQFLGLCMIAVLLITLGALIWMTTGGLDSMYTDSLDQALWFSWGMFFDPGTQTGFAASDSLKFKTVAVLFSVSGFIYNLVFLGVIVDIVRSMLEQWRLSRSRIVANGHTLLLGWTQKSLFLIEQLKTCFENQGQPFHLVILADDDNMQIKREIDRHFPKWTRGRHIQVRTGSPFECNELERVSAKSADSIIVLSGAGSSSLVDRTTVRSIIALAALAPQPKCPIVAEVRAPETSQAIRVIMDRAEGIYARDAVRRLMCLKAAQPAVGDVYEQMMCWSEGCEVYVMNQADLDISGVTNIGQAQGKIPRGTIIGVRPHEQMCRLALPPETKLAQNDHLLVLAESLVDLGRHKESKMTKQLRSLMQARMEEAAHADRFLDARHLHNSNILHKKKKLIIVVGWPSDVTDMIIAFEGYLAKNSKVIFFASRSKESRDQYLQDNLYSTKVSKNSLDISNEVGNSANVNALKQLPLNEADAIIVVADEEYSNDPTTADSVSLQSAISVDGLLRGRYKKLFTPEGDSHPRLICEVQSAATERALKSAQSKPRAMSDSTDSERDVKNAQRNREESLIQYFQSGSLETGLFTIASTSTPVFNALLMLLQSNLFGDIVGLPVESYIPAEEQRGTTPTKQDLFKRARASGDVLLSVVGPKDRHAMLTPVHEQQGPVEPGSLAIVVSQRFCLHHHEEAPLLL